MIFDACGLDFSLDANGNATAVGFPYGAVISDDE